MSKRKKPAKRNPGQAQRSINCSPADWAAFFDHTRTQGKVTADVLGDLVRGYLAKTEIAPTLPKKAQAQLAAALRRQEQQFNFRVGEAVQAFLKESVIPRKIKAAEDLVRKIERRRGVMSKADYNRFRIAHHPDTFAHVSQEERNRLSQLWEELQSLLVAEKEHPIAKSFGLDNPHARA